MQSQKANWTQYATFAIIAILALGILFNVGNILRVQETPVFPDFPTAAAIAALIVIPDIPLTDNDKIDEIYDDIFEDDNIAAYARDLVLDEVDSRDFNKALVKILNAKLNPNFDIDSYRDITRLSIKSIDLDDDVEVFIDNEADVSFEVRVYYFVDEDEDETGKALVSGL
ncbi:hypothetical protein LCGC14_2095010, partial [marine sediment metagenome]